MAPAKALAGNRRRRAATPGSEREFWNDAFGRRLCVFTSPIMSSEQRHEHDRRRLWSGCTAAYQSGERRAAAFGWARWRRTLPRDCDAAKAQRVCHPERLIRGADFPRPGADSLARILLVAIGLSPFLALVGSYVIASSPASTNQGAAPAQPIPFSHQHHVAGLGIDCRYCHAGVEKSAVSKNGNWLKVCT